MYGNNTCFPLKLFSPFSQPGFLIFIFNTVIFINKIYLDFLIPILPIIISIAAATATKTSLNSRLLVIRIPIIIVVAIIIIIIIAILAMFLLDSLLG